MKNKDLWKASKFEIEDGKLKASRNSKNVSIASRLMVDLIAKFYQEMIPLYCKGKLLDLGCGNVPLYAFYQNYITDSICVDWENSLHVNPYLDFHADLNQPLPLESNAFDTVILSDVLEHLRKPEQLLKEIFRVLKPGGHLLVNVPFYYSIHEEPFDYFRYTEYALKSMAEDAGFEIKKINTLGGILDVIADVYAKLLIYIPILGAWLANFVQWKAKLLSQTFFSKKIQNKTANRFPLAYGLVLKKT